MGDEFKGTVHTVHDPAFCEKLELVISPTCSRGDEDSRIELTGDYRFEVDENGLRLPGMYLIINCKDCGRTTEDGDSEFWYYYKLDEHGDIVSKEDHELG